MVIKEIFKDDLLEVHTLQDKIHDSYTTVYIYKHDKYTHTHKIKSLYREDIWKVIPIHVSPEKCLLSPSPTKAISYSCTQKLY